MIEISSKVQSLKQPPIRSISAACSKVGGINLGQGICNLPIEPFIKHGACNAILFNRNSYSSCQGILELRIALADKIKRFNQFDVDPINELIVTHGATGAFVCAVKALFEENDEVILFEPFYPLHKSILEFFDIKIKTVPINLDDLSIDIDDIRNVITKKTKGIIICSPSNPCGKVFKKNELMEIGKLAESNNLVVITDEIYEYITYPEHQHVSLASIPQFKPLVVTISGFSKTYSMTGWRLGYASGPAHVIKKMSLVQDLLYVCPVTPMQYGVLPAFLLDDIYYQALQGGYLAKRNFLFDALNSIGMRSYLPQGTYYMFANFADLNLSDDDAAVKFFLNNAKVAAVHGSIFFDKPEKDKKFLRFCYGLNYSEIVAAGNQLKTAVINKLL